MYLRYFFGGRDRQEVLSFSDWKNYMPILYDLLLSWNLSYMDVLS